MQLSDKKLKVKNCDECGEGIKCQNETKDGVVESDTVLCGAECVCAASVWTRRLNVSSGEEIRFGLFRQLQNETAVRDAQR